MERITSINPDRIGWSIRERGIDVSQLAGEVQISEGALNDALAHGAGLTFVQLQKLAKYFNRGVLFFLEPGLPKEDLLYSPQFRTLASQKPEITPKVRALIRRVERQRDVFLALTEELGDQTRLFDPPQLQGSNPGEIGEAARTWLKLGETNSFETYRNAVEAKAILVFRTNGYNGDWQIPKTDVTEGFCLYDERCPVIVVKKHEADSRQVFTLFHELGHLLLQRGSYIDDSNDLVRRQGVERQANEFAGRVLVPESFLNRISLSSMPNAVSQLDDWLKPWRQAWSVSAEVILIRLAERGRIEGSTYEAYREWKRGQTFVESPGGSRAYRYREPLNVFGQTFARTVLEALNRRQITTNKASRYLDNIKLKDLRALESYVATH